MQTSQIPGGIQPHSQGSLFPSVIARVEQYSQVNLYNNGRVHKTVPALDYTSWELTLGDFCEKYATREDAEMVARGLLKGIEERNRAAMLAVLGDLPPDAPYVQQQVKLLAGG